MATLKTINPTIWTVPQTVTLDASFITKKFNQFADSQKSSHTLWWLLSLMIHGIVLIPLAWVLIYFYNGPMVVFLTTSLLCFFTSIVLNMGGSGIRTTLLCFAISIFLHLAMVVYVLI